MNREIKFRVWDKDKKRMRDVTGINWYDEYIWVDETPMSGDKLPIDVTPLMQFTGLKDKNGVEIYEGNIVKMFWQYDGMTNYDYEIIGEVKFEKEYLQYVVEGKEKEQITQFPFCECDHNELIELEVVGNIYENKDLLP